MAGTNPSLSPQKVDSSVDSDSSLPNSVSHIFKRQAIKNDFSYSGYICHYCFTLLTNALIGYKQWCKK